MVTWEVRCILAYFWLPSLSIPSYVWRIPHHINLGVRQSTTPTEGVATSARNNLFQSPRLLRYTHVTNQTLMGRPAREGNSDTLSPVWSGVCCARGSGVLMGPVHEVNYALAK